MEVHNKRDAHYYWKRYRHAVMYGVTGERLSQITQEAKMQMVNCDKCGKPIDHTHFYKLKDKQIEHVDCNNLAPTEIRLIVKKTLPDFTWENKDRSKTV